MGDDLVAGIGAGAVAAVAVAGALTAGICIATPGITGAGEHGDDVANLHFLVVQLLLGQAGVVDIFHLDADALTQAVGDVSADLAGAGAGVGVLIGIEAHGGCLLLAFGSCPYCMICRRQKTVIAEKKRFRPLQPTGSHGIMPAGRGLAAPKAMKRKRTRNRLSQRILSSMDALRTGRAGVAEHGLRAAQRAFGFGCDGIARHSDRVSINHFWSEPDKACCRERQAKQGGNTEQRSRS